ncbi:hypothetical protein BDV96DRAFT_572001 [Lophiotrema nucula]|uniref:Transcription factor domain-containing protein n=1 Tax=Lophiotrema nucula TaxID=690887 RepID=A0A6A5ZD69_9PLEO|nr:hypothetical protein BDV96DRAFT_572001 [Lophiotrema nucula]
MHRYSSLPVITQSRRCLTTNLACVTRQSRCEYITKDETETRTMALKRENSTLKESHQALEELVNNLRFMPEEMAQTILQRLRTTSDPTSVLQSVDGSVFLGQPTEKAVARNLLKHESSIQSDMEFELMVKHPAAYPTLNVKPEIIPGLASFINPEIPPTAAKSSLAFNRAPYGSGVDCLGSETPSYDPDYADPRLRTLEISFWTTVPITNEYAAKALSIYFETDQPILGVFEVDLFIRDLIALKFDYCSAFLVSALLAFSSQTFAIVEPEAASKVFDFQQEAEELWRVEKLTDSLPAVAGVTLLSLSFSAGGNGEAAKTYLEEGVEMAKRLKLFGIFDTLKEQDVASFTEDHQRAIRRAAWGVFNNQTMHALYYVCSPTQYPPRLQAPGGRIEHVDQDDIEDTVQHSPDDDDAFQQIFGLFCSIWRILAEILFTYRNTGHNVPLAFALSRYHRLLVLADDLVECTTRKERNMAPPACVLVFHIFFHCAIIDIFRPFIAEEKHHGFRSFKKSAPSPEAIFAASVKQLKALIFSYRDLKAPISNRFWHCALMYVAGATLKEWRWNPEWRYYFLLCLYSYQKYFTAFAVYEEIVLGLLMMAISNGALRGEEARLITQELRKIGAGDVAREKEAERVRRRKLFMIDFDRALTDQENASLDTLIQKYEEVTIFDEFTEGIV